MFFGKRFLGVACLGLLVLSGCSAEPEFEDLNYEVDWDSLSEYQKEILEDGVVTYAEYEKAATAEYECVKSVSPYFSVGPIEIKYGQFFYVTTTSYPEDITSEEIDRLDAQASQCDTEYLSEVGMQWASQDVPDADEREKMRPEVMACFAAAGLAVDASTTDEQFQSASEAYVRSIQNEDVEPGESIAKMEALQACQEKHYRFFTFIPEKSN